MTNNASVASRMPFTIGIYRGPDCGRVCCLLMGFGLSVKETSLLIQCALFITGIATIISPLESESILDQTPHCIRRQLYADYTNGGGGQITSILESAELLGRPWLEAVYCLFWVPIAIRYLHKYFSPTVTGAVVLTVGICIGATAFGNFNVESETAMTELAVAVMVVVVIVLLNFFGKGLIKQCCILIGMVIGYVVAAALGMVDFSSIGEASWFSMVKPFAWE